MTYIPILAVSQYVAVVAYVNAWLVWTIACCVLGDPLVGTPISSDIFMGLVGFFTPISLDIFMGAINNTDTTCCCKETIQMVLSEPPTWTF